MSSIAAGALTSASRLDAATLLGSVAEALLVVGDDGVIRWASPSVRQLGSTPEQATGRRLVDLFDHDDRAVLARMVLASVTGCPGVPAHRVVRLAGAPDGGPRHVEVRVEDRTAEPGIEGIVVHAWDVTEAVQRHERVERLALHDPLTGLPNRLLFSDRLALELRRMHRNRSQLAVIYADVDGLKRVNDRFGHAAGDAVLVTVADRIATSLRPADTAARLSGDEFAIVCHDVDDARAAQQIAMRLATAVRMPIQVAGTSINVTVSVGVAMATEHDVADGGNRLLDSADAQMYSAKSAGRRPPATT